MTVYLSRGLCAAIACVASTQTAFADLSAQDVWTDWKTYLSSAGYTVSGDEQTSGNVLTVSNIAMSMELPEDEGDISIGIGSVNFTENGDGTVSIDMPESIPVNMSVIGENASAVDFVVTYVNKDQVLKASGEANDLLYTYAASSIGFDMTSLTVDGEAIPASMAQGSMSLTKLAGTTRMTVGDTRNYAQEMTAESLNYDLNFKDPESDDNGTIVGAMQGIGITGTGVLPKDMNPNDVVKMLADGFAADGTFTYASGTSSIKGTGDGEPFAFSSASQGGQVGVRLDAGQLAYNVEQKQTALSMQGAELPFPVELNAQVAALDIAFPMMKSDDRLIPGRIAFKRSMIAR